MAAALPTPDFARPVEVPRAVGRETLHRIAATAVERAALAERFDLIALDRLEAEVRLSLLAGGLVRFEADMTADVVQACVVTLEPVAGRLEETFSLLYGRGGDGGEIVLDGEAEIVEPFDGSRIDIGEAVAQQLSLVLDPAPRAPDAPTDGET